MSSNIARVSHISAFYSFYELTAWIKFDVSFTVLLFTRAYYCPLNCKHNFVKLSIFNALFTFRHVVDVNVAAVNVVDAFEKKIDCNKNVIQCWKTDDDENNRLFVARLQKNMLPFINMLKKLIKTFLCSAESHLSSVHQKKMLRPWRVVSMYRCIHVTLYPCFVLFVYRCIRISLYSCIVLFVYRCIHVSLYPCGLDHLRYGSQIPETW